MKGEITTNTKKIQRVVIIYYEQQTRQHGQNR